MLRLWSDFKVPLLLECGVYLKSVYSLIREYIVDRVLIGIFKNLAVFFIKPR